MTPAPHAASFSNIRIAAPAKINLVLRILDRRPDGYHNLWSLMHTVGLEDELICRAAADPGVHLTCSDPSLPTDDRNLAVRAAKAVLERTGCALGVSLELTKRIPMGGGLGGGSSDAAAAIMALNALFELGLTREAMAEVGADIGSDVPFFFYGPSAVITGRGESVRPVTIGGGPRWAVLINPGFGIETRWAYGEWAARRAAGFVTSRGPVPCVSENLTWDDVVPLIENDFERVLWDQYPLLQSLTEDLKRHGARAALLSGSGATVFGLFWDRPSAEAAAENISTRHRVWTATVPTAARQAAEPLEASPHRRSVG